MLVFFILFKSGKKFGKRDCIVFTQYGFYYTDFYKIPVVNGDTFDRHVALA
jgi:hypothetical protein